MDKPLDQGLIDLFDRYTHGAMGRRAFLQRLSALAGGTAAASAALSLLENDYARAEVVPETDPSIAHGVRTVGEGGKLWGYVAAPASGGKRAGVLVIHENRGLNPHIKDIARRLAKAGYQALALDFLSPLGGTPEDPDKARDMIGALKQDDVTAWAREGVAALKAMKGATGGVGAVGFCWGGGNVNELAAAEPTLKAAVAYYGRQLAAEKVREVHAPLLLHYAGLDERIDAGVPAFEAALKAEHKPYELYLYPGVNHAFNNDTNAARYDKAAADLAWARTLAFLRKHLRGGK